MKFISSAIGIEVEGISDFSVLKNHSKLIENGNKTNTNSFYSIIFTDGEKNNGEIHFTKSYEYGSFNAIPFVRIRNIFFILTTNSKHLKYFKYILDDMLKTNLYYKRLKFNPLYFSDNFSLDNFKILSKNEYEIIGIFGSEEDKSILKFYSNGIISFPHNKNLEQLFSVLEFYLEIINRMERF